MGHSKDIKEAHEFDERQLQIRGDIFKHGFLAAMLLLMLNALLNDFGIIWASGFQQNVLIMLMIVTVISVESHIRGVFFGRNIKSMIFLFALGLCTGVLAGLTVSHFSDGAVFADEGMLSDEGYTAILCGLLSLNVIVGFVQHFRRKKQETEE